jgi:hypothetical protein
LCKWAEQLIGTNEAVYFIIWFISLSDAEYLFDYIFRPSAVDFWDFGVPLGL